jgi:uncharacterized protein (DUF885 family)
MRLALMLGVFLLSFSISAQEQSEGVKLNKIIDENTEFTKRLDPFSAPYFNIEADLEKFGDYPSDDLLQRAKKQTEKSLHDLKSINVKKLAAKDLIAYKLFKGDQEVFLEGFQFPGKYLEFTQMVNRLRAYIDLADPGISTFPFDTLAHYEAFLKRSEGFPSYVDRQIALLKEGVKKNITLSCTVAPKVVNSYIDGTEPVVEKNPFYKPFKVLPKTISKTDQARLQEGSRKMIAERIVPGFKKFDTFFKTEYQPHCRKEFGIGKLPNGKKYYDYMIKSQTNLALSPKVIHQMGLDEVKRINEELAEVQKELGYTGTKKEFFAAILSDPKFFFKSSDELFSQFQKVKIAVAEKIPAYFRLIPKTDYTIVSSTNSEDPIGQYDQPTEMKPEGRFIVNTSNPKSIPRYEVTTLSLHEASPGHHFQFALQYEMKDQLTEYQRKIYISNSFIEGWALYTEYLGREMGFFKDPVQRLGNLNDELLRAVRLVVDTGIHSMGWDQKKTIEYMSENLASDAKGIEMEANRYSVMPGQALGYKIGQMKIIELRKMAEKKLGKDFDLRDFHRVVIGTGTVSLPVLEENVNSWVASFKRHPATTDL